MNAISVPTILTKLARIFSDAGHVLYAVGGLPRNSLLGLPLSDMDICSDMPPEQVLALCRERELHCVEKALQFGTVEIHYEGASFEHTTFRSAEQYAPGGVHRPVSVRLGASLEEDAFRRDFTVNALYLNVLTGQVIDPTGGLADLERGLLRATSPNPQTILQDDGLRVLRLIRFAVELNLTIEPATLAAAKRCARLLAGIAWERKREELVKILCSDARYPARYGELTPAVVAEPLPAAAQAALLTLSATQAGPSALPGDSPSTPTDAAMLPDPATQPAQEDIPPTFAVSEDSPVLRGLRLLESVGCWDYLIPELLEGKDIHQRPRHHAYTVLEHNYHCCACIAPAPLLRVTALLHDVGKPAALREKELPPDAGATDAPKVPHPMLGHDSIGADMAKFILARLRFSSDFIEEACFLIAHHMFDLNEMAKESTLRMRFCRWGRKRARQLIALREADFIGSGILPAHTAKGWRRTLARMEREGAPFSLAELALNGSDVMRIKDLSPGPDVGRLLEMLLRHCARFPKDNTPERLAAVLKGLN